MVHRHRPCRRLPSGDFSSPAEVIHLDRIYIPATQPLLAVASLVLRYPDGSSEDVLQDGAYRVF